MAQTHHTHIIAVGSQKGGVAKTTNCVHIAAALAERGRKCLIWDLDMNHGATLHLGVPSDAFLGSFEVLTGEETPQDVIITSRDSGVDLPENVDLIAGGRHLEQIDHTSLVHNTMRVTQDMLSKPLAALNGTYDYILLDTAPNLTLPTLAAYKTAQWFILSATPEPFAIAGLGNALRDLHMARTSGHSRVRLLGVVISCFDARMKVARSFLEYIEENLTLPDGTTLSFATTITRSTVVAQAQQVGKTLFQTHPEHQITKQYRALAQEIEARLQRDA
ncbi:MAG: ParA family protein [Candidatus Tectomicrobia bacterium]